MNDVVPPVGGFSRFDFSTDRYPARQRVDAAHRPDVDVRALLSVRCVVAPPVNPSPGSSSMHAWDVVMPGRR